MNVVHLDVVTNPDGTKVGVPRNPEILKKKIDTVPYDPRFPNTNQTKFVSLLLSHCFFDV